MKRWLSLLIFLLVSMSVFAANDPGHDSLYVLKLGDSNITGTINLTGNVTATLVQATSRFFGPNVDIRGDGTPTANANQIIGTATNLEVSSSGNLILNKAVTGGQVFVGWPGTTTALNVTGNILGAGNLDVSGTATVGGSGVCTAANGLCVSGGSGGGWVNDTTTTRNNLQVMVNSSNHTGSFIVQNHTGSAHLFVNGSNGRIGISTATPGYGLDVSSDARFASYTRFENDLSIANGIYLIFRDNANSVTNGLQFVLENGASNDPSAYYKGNFTFYGTSSTFTIARGGLVGINTTVPTQALDVRGSVNISQQLYVLGGVNASGASFIAGSQICTAANGLCSGGAADGNGGWVNDTTTTRNNLQVMVNSSNHTGSFVVQNQTGSQHLFVNGSSGRVGVGITSGTELFTVNGTSRFIGNQTYQRPGSDEEVCFERFVGTIQNYTRCINSTGHITERFGQFAVN